MNWYFNKLYYPVSGLTLAISIKLVLLIALLSLNNITFTDGVFYQFAGDTSGYLDPADNFIKTGSYSLNGENYAGRMPGYGIFYLFFRLALSVEASLNTLVIFQTFLSGLSVYYLAKTAFQLHPSKLLFLGTYILYAFSTYVSLFDFRLLPESLVTSFLIFSFYQFSLRCKVPRLKHLFISGFFLAAAAFMKPIVLPIFGLLGIVLLIDSRSIYLKKILAFTACILLFEACWITRNYSHLNRIVPTQTNTSAGNNYKPSTLATCELLQAWGEDVISWNPNATSARWFDKFLARSRVRNHNLLYQSPSYPLPSRVYTKEYNRDSLLALRTAIHTSADTSLTEKTRLRADEEATTKALQYKLAYVKEKPMQYFVVSPIRLIGKFLFHSGTYNLTPISYADLSLLLKAFKLLMTALYLIVICGGILGILTAATCQNYKFLILTSIPVYFILVYSGIFRIIEYRYLVPAYPFLLISLVYTLSKLLPNTLRPPENG